MRMRRALLSTIAVLLLASACSGDSTGPAATYEDVSGTYNGSLGGVSQDFALDAIFSLTFTQNQGALAGTYSISGTLSDGFETGPISETGTITGTIASGTNPSLTMAIRVPGCLSYQANFLGAYDSANKRITLTGPVDVVIDCDVFLRYNTVIILNR